MTEHDEPDEPLPGIETLRREADLPRELQDRIAGALRDRGLLRPPARRARRWWAAAAAVALFGAGLWFGRLAGPAASAGPGPRFVLFLEPLAQPEPDASAETARVAEYRAWARRVHASGRSIGGEKLRAGFRLVGSGSAQPGPSTCESVGGYFVISARDYEDALSVARDCPHARHGGTVVVRAIEPTG